MGLLDKAKAAAEQAAAKTKQGVDDVQTKRELSQSYNELGKAAFELIEAGEITHPRLTETAAKIRELNEKSGSGGSDGTSAEAAAAYDSSQPPAMPT
jgi:hypothetical protein